MSTSSRMPLSSNTLSPSRCSSKASAYWKPEQPPPRTPTRSPAVSTTALCDARNSRTFSAPLVGESDHCFTKYSDGASLRLGGVRNSRGAQGTDRGGHPRRRWRRSPATVTTSTRCVSAAGVRGPAPDRPAPARLRRVRRRDRRPHPCALDPDSHASRLQRRPDERPALQPDARRDPGSDRREPVILFMKGTPGRAGVRLLGPHRRDPAVDRARASPPSTSCPTRGSARSSRRSPTGRRSLSCSSAASWSAAATSSSEMYESGELSETLGIEDARRRSRRPRPTSARLRPAVDREPALADAGPIGRDRSRAWRGRCKRCASTTVSLWALDQTLLPWHERWLELRDAQDVADAIERLSIRGAPLIGVAAGTGSRLSWRATRAETPWSAACELLRRARPTAVNLAYAVDRVPRRRGQPPGPERAAAALDEAARSSAEENAASDALATHGADLLRRRPSGECSPTATPERWRLRAAVPRWRSIAELARARRARAGPGRRDAAAAAGRAADRVRAPPPGDRARS